MASKVRLLLLMALTTALFILPHVVAHADPWPCSGQGC